jgi:hypothetical protein
LEREKEVGRQKWEKEFEFRDRQALTCESPFAIFVVPAADYSQYIKSKGAFDIMKIPKIPDA